MKANIILSMIIIFLITNLALSDTTVGGETNVKVAAEETTSSSGFKISDGYGVKCFWFHDDNETFDLSPLENFKEPDKKEEFSSSQIYYYNFCSNTFKKCNDKDSFFHFVHDTNCYVLAGNESSKNKWDTITKTTQKDGKDIVEVTGVRLKLNEGEACKDNKNKNYQVVWEITCDSRDTAKYGEIEITNRSEINIANKPSGESCEITIKALSIHGCTLTNYYAVSAFVRTNKVIFCIIFLIVGLFLTYLGSKIISITLFITAFFATIIGIFLIVFGMAGAKEVKTGIMWVILCCSIILGIIVAYLFYKFKKVFYASLGGITGYFVGMFLYNFFLRYIKSNPNVVYWVLIVVCILLGILFAWFMEKHLVIISTSILGSYMIIRGGSFVIGGFPSEGEVVDLIKRKEYDQLSSLMNATVYIYMAVLLLFIASGIYVQYKYYTPEEEDKTTDKDIKEGLNKSNV